MSVYKYNFYELKFKMYLRFYLRTVFSEFVELSVEHNGSHYTCCNIGYRHAYPYSVRTEEQRQDEQTRYQYKNLTA